jgi:hypothetical protein
VASKYGKYITTELKRNVVMPGYKGPQQIGQGYRDGYRRKLEHIIWMDSEVLPGGFYGEYTWQWPSSMQDQPPASSIPKPKLVTPELVKSGKVPGIAPHSHPFIEIFSYFGTNMYDPSDLGGEIEFWLENEKFTFTRSFMVYIPANMEHCPLVVRRIESPMFHMTIGSGDKYI